MKVLIIEDEIKAANKLEYILKKLNVQIEGICDSIAAANLWLDNNSLPDLLFLDVLLSDGMSFEIFKTREVNCPVVFVTAFSNYAIKAFKLHSIDYILKPFNEEDLKTALTKYEQMSNVMGARHQQDLYNTLKEHFPRKYKSRFFVKSGNDIKSITTNNISFFGFENHATILVDNTAKKYVINFSLDELEKVLDPSLFFRINRKYIANIVSVKNIKTYSKGKIQLALSNCCEDFLHVSKTRCKEFRAWLDD